MRAHGFIVRARREERMVQLPGEQLAHVRAQDDLERLGTLLGAQGGGGLARNSQGWPPGWRRLASCARGDEPATTTTCTATAATAIATAATATAATATAATATAATAIATATAIAIAAATAAAATPAAAIRIGRAGATFAARGRECGLTVHAKVFERGRVVAIWCQRRGRRWGWGRRWGRLRRGGLVKRGEQRRVECWEHGVECVAP